MQKSNPFNKANSAISNRQNPLTARDSFVSDKQKYKSVRIHPEDFRYLRAYAFYNEMNIIDVIALGVDLIREQKEKEEKELEELKSNQA